MNALALAFGNFQTVYFSTHPAARVFEWASFPLMNEALSLRLDANFLSESNEGKAVNSVETVDFEVASPNVAFGEL